MDNNSVSPEMSMTSAPGASNLNAGWSWGGFMFSPVLIFASRRYVWVLLYLLLFIPFVGWLIPMIVLGLKGRSLLMSGSSTLSSEEAKGFMKGVDHAGKIMFFVTLALLVLGIILGLVAGASLFGFLGGITGGEMPLDF